MGRIRGEFFFGVWKLNQAEEIKLTKLKPRKAAKTAASAKKHGGPRPGSGRKPKPRNQDAARKSSPRVKVKVKPARVAMASPEQVERARKYAGLALDTWADI